MRYPLIVAIMLISSVSFADEGVFDLGLGVFHSSDNGSTETKFLAGTIQEDLWSAVKTRYTGGFWLDSTYGKSNSGFVAGQLGFEVVNNGLVSSIFSGPSIITGTDSLLGGHFQFYNSLNFGMKDHFDNYLGVMYRHFSSAGFEMPNVGRDILGLELRFPL